MKLLVNTASNLKGGGVQVAKSFIEECKKFKEHEYHIVLGITLAKMIETEQFPDNFHFYKIGYRPATRVFSLKSTDTFFKTIEKKIQPEVVFTTSGPAYWRPSVPHLIGFNVPHHIYKESPYFDLVPKWKIGYWFLNGAVVKYFFRRDGDEFVVQTEDVNQRLKKWLNKDRIHTVSNTCNAHYFSALEFAPKLPARNKDEFRFLTLSAYYTHKNLDIIPRVLDELPNEVKQNIKFVVTLPKDTFDKVFSAPYKGFLYNVGHVPVEECASLYQECDAMFLPTLLECFSASYVEAMAMKKPILTSDMGFAHTVCKEAAIYFNPTNEQEIAGKIIDLIRNPLRQEELIKAGQRRLNEFNTAEQRAEAYLNICKDLTKERVLVNEEENCIC